jgi:hypothetical protein
MQTRLAMCLRFAPACRECNRIGKPHPLLRMSSLKASIHRADHSDGFVSSSGQAEHQLPGLILIVLAAACSALGTVNRSTPFVRLASILSASKSPDSVKSHSKSPIWYSW